VDACLDAGFIVNAPRPDILRLAPPLVISPAQLDTFFTALPGILSEVAAQP
jgi:acetylornithine/N-succinyldiaminopimelate aminotransferase